MKSKLFTLITLLFAFSVPVFSDIQNDKSNPVPYDTQYPVLLSLTTEVTPISTEYAEVTSISYYQNFHNESMEVTFRLPKKLDSAFKSLSTTFEEKVFRTHAANSTDPETYSTQRATVRPVVKPGSHNKNTTELVIGTLHPNEILKISFSLMRLFSEEENNLFCLDIPFTETGATFLSSSLSKKDLNPSKLLNKVSLLTEWNVSIHNTEEFELRKGSSWAKFNETADKVIKYMISKNALEAANDFEVCFKHNNLTELLETEEKQEEKEKVQEKINDPITPSLFMRGSFRLLQEVKENDSSEELMLKMFGNRVEEKQKAVEKKTINIEEKMEANRQSDELLTNIVMGVFIFTIFLYIVSKYLERKYRNENVSLQEEAEKVEKEYTEKFNKAQNRKNKKVK